VINDMQDLNLNHMLYEEMYKEIINGTIKIRHKLFLNIIFSIVTGSYKT
jgi:hypothetical protein